MIEVTIILQIVIKINSLIKYKLIRGYLLSKKVAMMKNISIVMGGIISFLAFFYVHAQDVATEFGGLDFTAELALGFNYDFVKPPLDVSFDCPKGYLGMNIPLKYSLPQSLSNNLSSRIAEQFSDSAASEEYVPQAYAKQNTNFSIKVDVPMLGGVATFSNMQMMYLQYNNKIGIPKLEVETEAGGDVDLFMRGAISVPIDLSIGWETMAFGYAYEVNDMLQFAFNLHRHTFSFDLKGKVDVDILGKLGITLEGNSLPPEEINYSLHNTVDGHYELEKWTPTFAIKYWRVSLTSRFGMNARPTGYLRARYSLPFFIDPETFTIDEGLMNGIEDQDVLIDYLTENDNLSRLRNSDTNTVVYSTTQKMTWKMPQAHTIMFDIIPKKLSISYTKLFGGIYMEISDPFSDIAALEDTTEYPDTLDFRFEALVDHMILLHGSFLSSFINIGIYSMDFSFRDNKHLLSNIDALKKMRFGKGIMTPVLNLGGLVGAKIQVLAEIDVLPLTAIKTGVVYNF